MQCSLMKSTMPLAYLTIDPGEGQALRQPGSSKCMQPSLRISHSSRVLSSGCFICTSAKRMTVQDCGVRSDGLSYCPTLAPTSSRKSFHCMHATWQALQPMQLETSISLVTSVTCRRATGGCVVVAERAAISRDWRELIVPPRQMPSCSRPLDVDRERLELRSLRVRVPHEGRQRVDQVPGLGEPDEAPVVGQADRIDRLAVHRQ